MDANVSRQAAALRAEGKHREAATLEWNAQAEENNVKEIAADVVKVRDDLRELAETVNKLAQALQAAVAKSSSDIATTRTGLLEALPALKKSIKEFVRSEIHRVALQIELEFGSCVSLTAGSGARKAESDGRMESALTSIQRQVSRHGEHLARLEDRAKRVERD